MNEPGDHVHHQGLVGCVEKGQRSQFLGTTRTW